MRTIAIVLGDNDFGNTFRPLLDTIYRVYLYCPEKFTKIFVEILIKESIKFHYLAFQSEYIANHPRITEIMDYLNGIKISFDDEAEKDIQEKDHDSGAWYLELESGKVYSY